MQACGNSFSWTLFYMQPADEEFDEYEFDCNSISKSEKMPGDDDTISTSLFSSPAPPRPSWQNNWSENTVTTNNNHISNNCNDSKISKRREVPLQASSQSATNSTTTTIQPHDNNNDLRGDTRTTHEGGCRGPPDCSTSTTNIHLPPIAPPSLNPVHCDQVDNQHELDHTIFDPATLERLGSVLNNASTGRGEPQEEQHNEGSLTLMASPVRHHDRRHRLDDPQPLFASLTYHPEKIYSNNMMVGSTPTDGVVGFTGATSSLPTTTAVLSSSTIPSISVAHGNYRFKPPVSSPAIILEELSPLPVSFSPGPYSVVIGRGGTANKCAIGNRRLRVIASTFLGQYSKAATKGSKSEIVSTIVNIVKEACPLGGAFVRMGSDGRWYEAKDTTAAEKVGYTLREMLGDKYKSSSKHKARRGQSRSRSSSTTSYSSFSSSSSSDEEDAAGKEEDHDKKPAAVRIADGSRNKSVSANHSSLPPDSET